MPARIPKINARGLIFAGVVSGGTGLAFLLIAGLKTVARVMTKCRLYHSNLCELSQLLDHELADIGLHRPDLSRLMGIRAKHHYAGVLIGVAALVIGALVRPG